MSIFKNLFKLPAILSPEYRNPQQLKQNTKVVAQTLQAQRNREEAERVRIEKEVKEASKKAAEPEKTEPEETETDAITTAKLKERQAAAVAKEAAYRAADDVLITEIGELRETIKRRYTNFLSSNEKNPHNLDRLITNFTTEIRSNEEKNIKEINKKINNELKIKQNKDNQLRAQTIFVEQLELFKKRADEHKTKLEEYIRLLKRKQTERKKEINQPKIGSFFQEYENEFTKQQQAKDVRTIMQARTPLIDTINPSRIIRNNTNKDLHTIQQVALNEPNKKFPNNTRKIYKTAYNAQMKRFLNATAAKRAQNEEKKQANSEENKRVQNEKAIEIQQLLNAHMASNIEKSQRAMLSKKHIQHYIFAILTEIHRAIYTDKDIIENKLQKGLVEEDDITYLIRSFNNEETIKKNIYRFFVKGSAAITLLNTKSTDAYPFTNDIDVILLINPALSDANYNILHANLLGVVCSIIQKYILKDDIINASWDTVKTELRPFGHVFEKLPVYDENNKFPPIIEEYSKLDKMFVNEDHHISLELSKLHTKLVNDPYNNLNEFKTLQHKIDINTQELTLLPTQITNLETIIHTLQLYIDNLVVFTPEKKHSINIIKEHRSNLKILKENYAKAENDYKELQIDLHTLFTQINARPFSYALVFNKGYPIIHHNNAVSNIAYLDESIITIIPRFINNNEIQRKSLIELCDIGIPMKTNKFLKDDWTYYSVVTFNKPDQNIHFDVATLPYSLFDQDRALKGTPNPSSNLEITLPIREKYKKRQTRRKFLQARVQQLLNASNTPTKETLRALKEKMPADLFTELYPTFKGGRVRCTYKNRGKKVKSTRRLNSRRGRK